jgi:hypothetical protein
MDDLRHLPATAQCVHFCRVFANALGLPSFTVDRLEAALVDPAECAPLPNHSYSRAPRRRCAGWPPLKHTS